MALATDLRTGTDSLVILAERDLQAFWAAVAVYEAAAYAGDLAARQTLTEALHDVLPGLAGQYQDAAIALAAELYDLDRIRSDVPGTFRAPGIEIPDGGHALAGWALDEAADADGLRGLIKGGLVKRIMQAGNRTVTNAAQADPSADGWQRVARAKACPFCRFLASRGDVYAQASVTFASHDHCHCVATVAWSGRPRPVRLDAEGRRLDRSTRASRTDDEKREADNEQIRDWIAAHPDAG